MSLVKKVVLALGSNMGEPIANLCQAIAEISTFAKVELCSGVYQTAPVGYLDQDDFFNAVILCKTEHEPLQLLERCKGIEANMGRIISFRNAPRPIDIDIIFYEGVKMDTDILQIPHPRWHERDFVLSPLSDIKTALEKIDFKCDVMQKLSTYQKNTNQFQHSNYGRRIRNFICCSNANRQSFGYI